jgi:ArsR family transcriptional regulator, cadmium/lead-responsive transcriptional repressor
MLVSPLQIKAKFYQGLGDPTRLEILESLLNGEKSVSAIVHATKQSQSNVSNHLRCLVESGLVANHREGKYVQYRLRDRGVKKLLETTDRVVSKVYADIARCVEVE